MRRNNIILILTVFVFVALVGGVSYAYFVYDKEVADVTLNAGEISINLQNVSTNNYSLNGIPKSDSEGKASNYYLDFEVTTTVDSDPIYYEVYILPTSGSNLDTSYLKTYLTDQSDVDISGVRIYSELQNSEKSGGKVLYKGLAEINSNYATRTETKDFRLRLWIDENYSEINAKSFSFNIYLYAHNVSEDFYIPYGATLAKQAINAKVNAQTNSCNPAWVDDMGTANDESDDVIYFSGTNDCVDMNYVWYSGKLWRIVAIYPDGAMKMVTEKAITYIDMLADQSFYTSPSNTSIMYKWLNEDFLDTLYNHEYIIDSTKVWNQTPTAYNSDWDGTNNFGGYSARPANTSTFSANVGLLNSYECYATGVNDTSGGDYPYTQISYNFNQFYTDSIYTAILLNRSSSENSFNRLDGFPGGSDYSTALLPAIYVKNNAEIKSGDGTIDNPYMFLDDKSTGSTNDMINTRLSGEYVKFANTNDLFRIIGTEDNTTKIIRVEPLQVYDLDLDTAWYSQSFFGNGTATGPNTWHTYLNTTWYNSLTNANGNLFTMGKYYKSSAYSGDYRQSICATANSPISTCTKLPYDSFNVGIPRHGEMFTIGDGIDNGGFYIGLITKWGGTDFMGVINGDVVSIYSEMDGGAVGQIFVQPTLNLSSSVKIVSGSGTSDDPYVVGL